MAYCRKCGYGIGSQGHYDYCIAKDEDASPRSYGGDYPLNSEWVEREDNFL